ncbi:hypothetical protein F3J23_05440 [Chryseobacterium sp. Tr-659]|uniref:M56 family metallopeptidase n=1 Tax=Chryseobacterium sp. Tr-659 TaxID=2608340 RepID=UPI001421EF5B|nr:M56 family metallopeptidase [Chryseobacterium sp. Tr-659]NIF04878.1 hypothetical protein [Chryseobacterium sp. Tr-659]
MEAILLYFGKTIVCSGVMFLYYQLSLKDKTFHHYNRFYLLAAILISLLLPLIRVDDFTIEVNSDVYMLLDKIQNFNTEKNTDNGNLYFNIIFSTLGLVSLYFLGKLIYGIFKIQQFKKQFQKESFDGINFYRTDLNEAPFSYFKNLFWKNAITLNSDLGKQILKHEMVHIEQKHSFDKILIEIITSVFWFNPFFHIIKREINLIHEYLADKKAVKHSDTKAFAQMLLASHFSGTQLPAASPFLSSNLKKRLKMLQKPKTQFGYARRILALPVLFSVAFAYLVNAKNREIEETNLHIEKAVAQIQKDTVRPEKTAQEEIQEPTPKSSDSQKRMTEIDMKIKKKGEALKKLEPGSKAFNKKIEEINVLAAEIGRIAGEEASKANYAMDVTKNLNNYFNSFDWKQQMKALDNMEIKIPDIPEFDIDIPEIPSAPGAPKSPKVFYFKNGTVDYRDLSPAEKEEVRKAIKEAKKAMKEGEKARREGAKARIEGEKARIEGEKARAEGDRARIEGEKARAEGDRIRRDGDRARIEGEKARAEGDRIRREGDRARIEGDKIRMEGDRIRKEGERIRKEGDRIRLENEKVRMEAQDFKNGTVIKISSSSPGAIVMNADFIKKDGNGNISMNGVKKFNISGDDTKYKYYIDGKEVSKEEVNTLLPANIARIMVNKQQNGDFKKGEVKIETKK